jgi:gamma-glutamylputrescine oxidase
MAQHLNSSLDFGSSYYVATAHAAPERPALTGEAKADLVVVGGGCTGLSAALHAARAGRSVILLEGGKVGWGASGRNGGQLIPGLRKGAAELVAQLGETRARALFDLSLEARALVLSLIEAHGIDCDLVMRGHVLGIIKPRDMAHYAKEVECLNRVMNYPHARLLDASQVGTKVATPEFVGGLEDDLGGHLHPLNYTLGLARAAEAAGVRICELSTATGLERAGAGVTIFTATGLVHAEQVVLAGDALLTGLNRRVNSRIMPVASYVVTTEPLDDAQALIPQDHAVSDARFVVDYFRRTPDNSLLFGGGERYTPDPPANMAEFVRPFVERAFPQLRGVKLDHAWGGLVSVTLSRLPHMGREGPVLFAHGYSGQGALLSTLGGKLLAEALDAPSERLERFASLEPAAFPGGALMRNPLYLAGMLWYALKDRL